MKIVIADAFPAEARTQLGLLGLNVVFEPKLSADTLPDAVGDASILVVRSTKVTAQTIEAAPRLQVIIRAGAGTNTIDCAAAAHRGVFVANCPGKNAIAVAELTMGLIIASDRRIPSNVQDLREGTWNKKRYAKARGLYGRTLGVIGVGRIGREVVGRARAFGMRCIVRDRTLTEADVTELGVELYDTVEDVCSRADIITLHVPLNDETRHMIGPREIASMRQGALVINMARGGVVDDEALAEAVAAGRIRAAADVYEREPKGGQAVFESALGQLDDFYGTHHIGASTEQAQAAIAAEVLDIVGAWLKTGTVKNHVNLSPAPPAQGLLLVRHLDRVGVLATVLDVLKRADINVQDMSNTIFDGAVAACAKIAVEEAPSPSVLADLASCSPDVLGIEWIPNRS